MNVTDLTTFGWGEFFEANFKTYAAGGYTCGRVALEHKNLFRVYTQHGEVLADLSGKLRHEAVNRGARSRDSHGPARRGRLCCHSSYAPRRQSNDSCGPAAEDQLRAEDCWFTH